jgi:hypothetical protein
VRLADPRGPEHSERAPQRGLTVGAPVDAIQVISRALAYNLLRWENEATFFRFMEKVGLISPECRALCRPGARATATPQRRAAPSSPVGGAPRCPDLDRARSDAWLAIGVLPASLFGAVARRNQAALGELRVVRGDGR